ncbi:MAG TPA: NAD(P)H-dependent oxidoreductase subunit E [Thermoanaerobaculia bacterium]|nr:NAD(P)H-dependent oxidoreductase subunit E [Thermoanaerobaculia bacterium]
MAELQPENPYAPDRFPDPAKKVEFSLEAKRRFDDLLPRYPTRMAVLLPTLHLAQEEWGWISPEVVVYVADLLELSPATVFGVVSFYNMYNQRPVGKYHLQVCTNLSCMLGGAYDIYDRLQEKLGIAPGETTADGRFTLVEVECLGSCDTAPVVQVNNDYHEGLTMETTERLVDGLK